MKLRLSSNLAALRAISSLLSNKDRMKIKFIILSQTCLSFMDLFGVFAFGLMAVSTLARDSEESGTSFLGSIFYRYSPNNFSSEELTAFFALVGCFIFICRTIISVYLTKRVLVFLSSRAAGITSELLVKLLSKPLIEIQKRSLQESIFALTTGVEHLTLYVLGTSMILVSDVSLLFILIASLLLIDFGTAIVTLFFLGMTGLFLYITVYKRVRKYGEHATKVSIKSNSKISEIFMALRETQVRNRSGFYADELYRSRIGLAKTTANLAYLPYVSKYVIETAIIIGALCVGVFQYFFSSVTSGISTVAIFLAAGTRIAPAVLRVQQGILDIKAHAAKSTPTLELIEEVSNVSTPEIKGEDFSFNYPDFVPSIKLNDVTFYYPGESEPTLQNITLEITPHTSVAIVGKSGAGKSTLVDVILGILEPDTGQVQISDHAPLESVLKWPGAISYMPQEVSIFDSTYRENIGMGYPVNLATDEKIKKLLGDASLLAHIENSELKYETPTGENGNFLSGGQRQRLALARTLYTNPKLLILDEATSALDLETEGAISDMLRGLGGTCTIILIAHRLSTIKRCDKVVYLESGKILATGTFDEVKSLVPDFDSSVKSDGD